MGDRPRHGRIDGALIVDPTAFVRAETRLLAPPLVPEVRLHLAEESIALWQRTEDELERTGLPPPFWAFAWAGGQALARHILDAPGLVRGKRVLDFAAGSGLVAIAALKAGAAAATACDIDVFAAAAMAENAAANGVTITIVMDDLIGRDVAADVILAGDICYERDLSARVFDWLEGLAQTGRTVLIGDPGRTYLPKDRLERVACYHVPVTRALEDAEIKATGVWTIRA